MNGLVFPDYIYAFPKSNQIYPRAAIAVRKKFCRAVIALLIRVEFQCF